ncbi:hypothetical protein AO1008_02653 [Aspergillus oryzae 100-8]|uniref:Uncharacterized protein n=1 Tax=Aspergillus oryzae (strain 3.042) TaxID=1160506 RepID=I8AA83_ASPO3|nr:hypothetical protein Ao3042_00542 [Aspergillus oryzae 3.042]KDE76736.1 hypothetical protein AO1008_02653 [Aspergillus oryzae 100-8]|eukprot:EIT82257.1 hypothetical protein Ao3042_00542 [Aspergillus oryzae 3.042]
MATTPSLQNNLGFRQVLQMVKPHSLEDTVEQVWQAIVISWFPSREGYIWSFKGPALVQNDIPNFALIQVMKVSPNREEPEGWSEHLILLVECKRPSSDVPLSWDNTLFGIVAIGTKSRFYRFGGQASSDQLAQLHQGTLDMSEPTGIAHDGLYQGKCLTVG